MTEITLIAWDVACDTFTTLCVRSSFVVSFDRRLGRPTRIGRVVSVTTRRPLARRVAIYVRRRQCRGHRALPSDWDSRSFPAEWNTETGINTPAVSDVTNSISDTTSVHASHTITYCRRNTPSLYFTKNAVAEKAYILKYTLTKWDLNQLIINNTVSRLASQFIFCAHLTDFARYIL